MVLWVHVTSERGFEKVTQLHQSVASVLSETEEGCGCTDPSASSVLGRGSEFLGKASGFQRINSSKRGGF